MDRLEGEAAQAKGSEGARRAKKWLEATTRVRAEWVNPDPPALEKLRMPWPHGGNHFSFDLGGILRHEEFQGQEFLAEVKNYSSSSDLAAHYEKFIAQCYVAYQFVPSRCNHFMWISWSPHSAKRWNELTTPDYVRSCVVKHRRRIVGVDDESEAIAQLDAETIARVAERLWIIILSQKQESLVISTEHRALVEAEIIRKGAS